MEKNNSNLSEIKAPQAKTVETLDAEYSDIEEMALFGFDADFISHVHPSWGIEIIKSVVQSVEEDGTTLRGGFAMRKASKFAEVVFSDNRSENHFIKQAREELLEVFRKSFDDIEMLVIKGASVDFIHAIHFDWDKGFIERMVNAVNDEGVKKLFSLGHLVTSASKHTLHDDAESLHKKIAEVLSEKGYPPAKLCMFPLESKCEKYHEYPKEFILFDKKTNFPSVPNGFELGHIEDKDISVLSWQYKSGLNCNELDDAQDSFAVKLLNWVIGLPINPDTV